MRKVTFELKDKIINEDHAIDAYITKINNCLGLNEDEMKRLQEALKSINLNHYYTASGSKITKKIKSILNSCLKNRKNEILSKWAQICQEIRNLYWASEKIHAFWGSKELLGEGEWEEQQTCFRRDGCNNVSKQFVVLNKRFKALVIQSLDANGYVKGVARCIVYFSGNREIYLTNFYFKNDIFNNRLIFLEAIRRLLNLEYITYKKIEEVPFPIYANGDGYVIRTKRVIPEENRYKGQKWVCPKCKISIPSSKMKSYKEGTTVFIGCSNECLETEVCCECNTYIIADDAIHGEDGWIYCASCFNVLFRFCEACRTFVHYENYMDNNLCCSCGFTCCSCGHVYSRDEELEEADGRLYCKSCFADLLEMVVVHNV